MAGAEKWGVGRIVGEFIPTAKNGMVRDHYAKLGFAALDRANYQAPDLFMTLKQG